jgi:hypothetical protein
MPLLTELPRGELNLLSNLFVPFSDPLGRREPVLGLSGLVLDC